MANNLLITDVLPRGHQQRCDVLIMDGKIVSIGVGPAAPDGVEVIDGSNQVLLPGFVDAHSHLDKSLVGMPWYRREPGRGLQQMVADERRLRKTPEWDYQRQIGRNAEIMISNGATSTRAFVDIDTDGGLRGLEAMLAVRETYAHALTMQIIAFPQSGVAARPGTAELLDQALACGADVIGGIDPCLLERDPVQHLDLLFALAERHHAGVDVHLHEGGALGAFSAELIIERTRRAELAGRVVISHPDFLGGIGESAARKLVDDLAEAGVAVTTNAPSGDPKPPLPLLRASGVNVGAGCDGALDSWGPMNRSDMLFKGYQLAWRNGLSTDDELDTVFDLISVGGAAIMDLDSRGITVGGAADLVLLPGETPIEPIVTLPVERTVIKAGRVVARAGTYLPPRTPGV
ncbi:amidohydrolase [Microlunatus soli]|uniref:Cytosine/adenosine deaminase n=1 Tax=Microlunatus soli TaxID=630515 RepID=A0A1H1R3I3_9ACTN|nr:amidohydrolase [Microlunatus soli]SDS30242.1 Cytosine/adenosine deaminase [Microlunatus soli]